MADQAIRASIVLPTRNETQNLLLLIDRLGHLLDTLEIDGLGPVEVVVVDESEADVRAEVETHARRAGVAMMFLRPDSETRLGVAKSTMLGIRAAGGQFVLVMDADLQHPPEVALALLALAIEQRADIAVGTRYSAGGSAEGLSSVWRRVVSRTSTVLGRLLVGTTSDPMSGLFVLNRDSVSLPETAPDGFKLLMEIMSHHHRAKVVELPYGFQPRATGQSNASAADGLSFVLQLGRLTWAKLRGKSGLRTGATGRDGGP